MKLLIKILLIILCAGTVWGQQYIIKNYTAATGLPGSSINEIEQDSSGTIWIATREGIGYYDGIKWRRIRRQSSYQEKVFSHIEVDDSNTVWALNLHRDFFLFRINGNILVPVARMPVITVKNYIINGFEIIYSKGKRIFVVAINGRGLFINTDGNWKVFDTDNGLPSVIINSIIKRNNAVYISHSKGVSVLRNNLELDNSFGDRYNLNGKDIISILVDNEGKPSYYRTGDGVYKIDGKNSVKICDVLYRHTQFEYFSGIEYYNKDIIIFSSLKYVYLYNGTTGQMIKISKSNGLLENGARDIFVDREKTIWIAQYEGISSIPALDFINYSRHYMLAHSDITSIEKYNDSLYILGCIDGYAVLNINTFRFKNYFPKKLLNTRILDLSRAPDGKIWAAASNRGLFYLKDETKLVKAAATDETHKINAVVATKDGRVLFSNSDHLLELKNGRVDTLSSAGSLSVIYIRRIYESGDEYVLCTSSGIFKSNDLKNWKEIATSNVKGNNTFGYFKDEAIGELVGTLGGVYKVENDSLVKTFEEIEYPVYYINKDKAGEYWFGTASGVYRYFNGKLVHYNTQNGFVSDETNRDGFYSVSEELNLFGTEEGLSVFRREFDRYYLPALPKLKIVSSFAEGYHFDYSKEHKFDHPFNDLTFKFILSTSRFPEFYNIYAKLEGFQDNWEKLDEKVVGSISYKGLTSGDYLFKIKAVDQFGRETEEVVSGKISILKPYYKTTAFLIFVSFAFVFFAFVLVRLYLATFTEKKLKKELLQREKELFNQTQLFRQMFEKNRSVILIIDRTTQKIIDANDAAIEFYGYTKEEFTDKYFTQLFKDNYAVDVIDAHNRFMEVARCIHTLANGVEKNVELFSTVIKTDTDELVFVIINDIEEKVQNHKMLEEALQLYKGLVENMQDGLFMINDGVITFCNNSFASILGYSVEELIGQYYLNYIADESKPMVKERYEKRKRGEAVPNEYQFKLKHKNGKIITCNMVVSLIHLSSGVVSFGTIKDITESLKQQKELIESEMRYRNLFESSAMGMYRTTPDGRIEMANRAFIEMLGFNSFEEIKKLNIEKGELLSNFDRSEFKRLMEKTGYVRGFETKITRRDGAEIYIRESAVAFKDKDGKVQYYHGVIEDISELKSYIREVEQSEAKLNSLLKMIADPIFEISPLGTIHESKNEEKLLEFYGVNNLTGRNIAVLLPDDRKNELRDLLIEARSKKSKQASIFYEWTNNGEERFFQMRLSQFEKETMIVVVRDITERREFEKKIIDANELLKRADKMKEDFLIQISHEMRTPLFTIGNYLSLLEESLGKYMTEDDKKTMQIITNAGLRLTDTVESINKQAELTSGNVELYFTEFDLFEEVKSRYLNLWEAFADSKNLELNIDNRAEYTMVECDIETSCLIIRNIVKNAFAYTEKGKVEIVFYDSTDGLNVSIEDTGIGIDKDVLNDVFKPFYQEESGYTRRFDGIGLGLSISKMSADLNEVEITIESVKGKGTKVILLFKRTVKK